MADYAQICELFARYAAAIDGRDPAMLRDVLTDDAWFIAHGAGGPTAGPFESGGRVARATLNSLQNHALPRASSRRSNVSTPGDRAVLPTFGLTRL